MHVNNAASGEAPTRGSVGAAAPKSVGTITHCCRLPDLLGSYTRHARWSSLPGFLWRVKCTANHVESKEDPHYCLAMKEAIDMGVNIKAIKIRWNNNNAFYAGEIPVVIDE